MSRLAPALLLSAGLAASLGLAPARVAAQGRPDAAMTDVAMRYETLRARVAANDWTGVDFAAFRMAGIRQAGEDADMVESRERGEFKSLMADGKTAEAYAAATATLKRNYASTQGQFDAMTACRALGKTDEAAVHEKVLNALLDSLGASGDGKTAATAYVVATVNEEYLFLAQRMHAQRLGRQDLVRQGGHSYDRMTWWSEASGEHGVIWFQIDVMMGG